MSRFPVRAALVWGGVLAITTMGMLAARPALDRAHVALILLLVVLGGSSAGGRVLGVTLAGVSFFAFNWFFLPPYSVLTVANPLDWVILLAFFVTGIVAAQLVDAGKREVRTAQKQAAIEHEQALRRNEQMKDALLASVSHDLRTPLTTIKALAHDLSVLGDERSEIIEQEADRLTRSVADLLDLSRLKAGALPLRVELNAVDDLLGALMQRVERVCADRVVITLPQDDPLLVGMFDFVHTLRVVANLVENAAKYSPADSAIDVSARRRGADLLITVADRGPGVPLGDVDRVFDAYFRAANRAPDADGAGLGLSIARLLAEAQHGTLSYRPRPGGGSEFELRLPAADLNPLETATEVQSRDSR